MISKIFVKIKQNIKHAVGEHLRNFFVIRSFLSYANFRWRDNVNYRSKAHCPYTFMDNKVFFQNGRNVPSSPSKCYKTALRYLFN